MTGCSDCQAPLETIFDSLPGKPPAANVSFRLVYTWKRYAYTSTTDDHDDDDEEEEEADDDDDNYGDDEDE